MLILDRPRVFEGDSISIPLFHRGHLSLHPDTKVWVLYMPPYKNERRYPTLFISTVDTKSWEDLWRITATFKEAPGVVHRLLDLLATHSINIVSAESCTMDRYQKHSVEILIDAKEYKCAYRDHDMKYRRDQELETLNDLYKIILADMLKQIDFTPNSHKPNLHIRRVKRLFNTFQDFAKGRKKVSLKGTEISREPEYGESIVRRSEDFKRLVLPIDPKITERLQSGLGWNVKGIENENVQYLLVSDTKDHFLTVYFIPNSKRLINVEFVTIDRKGAFAGLTGAIKERFNILTFFSRVDKYGELGRAEFILEPIDDTIISKAASQKVLEELLLSKGGKDNYFIDFRYPLPRFGDDASWKKKHKWQLLTDPLAEEVVGPIIERLHQQVILPDYSRLVNGIPESLVIADAKLNELINESYPDKTQEPEEMSNASDVKRVARQLLKEIPNSNNKSVIFISHSMPERTIREYLDPIAEKYGIKVLTARDFPVEARTNLEAVVKCLKDQGCNGFLGIWTKVGGVVVSEDKYWPSPWLHFELGAACVLNLSWKLMIEKGVHGDAWQKIARDRRHSFFCIEQFIAQIEKSLIEVKNLVESSPFKNESASDDSLRTNSLTGLTAK
jgi:hypothetical protein